MAQRWWQIGVSFELLVIVFKNMNNENIIVGRQLRVALFKKTIIKTTNVFLDLNN